MSVGNVSQAISFSDGDLTLVIGDNLDLGGNGSRNGVGKCICHDTVIKIRSKKTGEIIELTVGEFYGNIKKANN
jgi:hypothetical protein